MKCNFKLIGIFALLLFANSVVAHTEVISEIESQIKLVGKHLQDDQLALSILVIEGLDILNHEVSAHRKISFGNAITKAYIDAEKYEEGIEYSDKILAFATSHLCPDDLEVGTAYMNAGTMYLNLNKLNVAESYLYKAKDILEYENDFQPNRLIAAMQLKTKEYGDLLKYITTAEKAFTEEIQSQFSQEEVFKFYGEVMSAYVTSGEKTIALEYGEKLVNIATEISDNSLMARAYINIAGVHKNYGDNRNCEYYLNKVEPLISEMIDPSSYYFYRGLLAFGKKDFKAAIHNLKNAVELTTNSVDKLSNTWLAFAYALNDDRDLSFQTLDTILDFYLKNKEQHSLLINETHRDFASIYDHFKMYEKGFEHIKKGIEAAGDKKDLLLYTNTVLIESYANYLKETADVSVVDSIFNVMEGSSSLLAEWRLQSRYDHTDNIDSPINTFYSRTLKSLTDVDTFLNQDERYLPYVFQYIDGMKSFSFKQSIQEKSSFEYSKIPEEVILEQKKLKNDINELQQQIYIFSELGNEEETKHFELELKQIKLRYIQFVNALENNYPMYFKHKIQSSETDLNTLQESLNSDEAIIEYYVYRRTMFTFAIEKDNLHLLKTALPKNFKVDLEQLLHSISDQDCLKDQYQNISLDNFGDLSTKFYNLLLKDVLADLNPEVKYLNIIPEDELNYIPFEILLQSKDGIEKGFKHLDYVLKEYTIAMQSSAEIYLSKQLKKRSTVNPEYVGFAPKYQNGYKSVLDSLTYENDIKDSLYIDFAMRGDLNDLPNARNCVAEIAKTLNGVAFLGDLATREAFIENDKSGKIVHLAMHGIANDIEPAYSQLVFSDESEDKHLYISDVINLDLDIELAILSACNTGSGKIRYGEGVQSMSYAFSVAGCSSLVMSLWSVPDVQTSVIDKLFVEQLYNRVRIDDALRESKLTYLENTTSRTSHPFYWAGLVASGKTDPVFSKQSFLASLLN